jgi:hypothetical protein
VRMEVIVRVSEWQVPLMAWLPGLPAGHAGAAPET